MEPLTIVAAVALLGVAAWWRAAPRSGGTRWWSGSPTNTRAALLLTPGVALILLSVWPLSGYDRAASAVSGEGWRLWFALPLLVGGVMALWSGLALPIPGWVRPRWSRLRKDSRGR